MNKNKKTSGSSLRKEHKKTSQLGETWKRLKRNKTAMLGLVIILILVFLAVFADVLYSYEDDVITQNISERLQKPSLEHPFGTDDKGRDILARVVYGARVSLLISFASVACALVIGCMLGSVAGYFGGWIDNIIMRFMDILLSIPGMLLALCIVAALGNSTRNLIMAVTVSTVPQFARIIRSSVLTVRDIEYIEAARAIGAKNSTIIFSHILPNSFAPVIVQAALNVGTSILTVAGLSFIGLGVSSPIPEWGAMLSDARSFIMGHGYMTLFPGLAIMLTILSMNLLSDGLRDALDPKLR